MIRREEENSVAKSSEDTRALDGLQGVVALVGITLGVIPFVRWVITGELGGLFAWIFGSFAETMGYAAPLIVVAVSVAVIAAFKVMKKRV